MSTQLIKTYVTTTIKKEDQRFLNYFTKHKRRFKVLLDGLKEGIMNVSECCQAATVPEPTYYEIMKYGKMVFKYIDDNDIEYKDTEYMEFINIYLMLQGYFIDGTKRKLKGINKLGKDRIITTPEGKDHVIKGDVKAATYVLNHSRNIEDPTDDSDKKTGINIVFNMNGSGGFDLASLAKQSQSHLAQTEKQNIINNTLTKGQ